MDLTVKVSDDVDIFRAGEVPSRLLDEGSVAADGDSAKWSVYEGTVMDLIDAVSFASSTRESFEGSLRDVAYHSTEWEELSVVASGTGTLELLVDAPYFSISCSYVVA
jgi:hypothetical protein